MRNLDVQDSGAGKCSKYVKLCIDPEQIEFYTLTRQHILYSIDARGKMRLRIFLVFLMVSSGDVSSTNTCTRQSTGHSVKCKTTSNKQRTKVFFLAETAFYDLWEHVLKLCQFLQPPNPQNNPHIPLKVKFFIYCEISMKFKAQHLYMFTNDN